MCCKQLLNLKIMIKIILITIYCFNTTIYAQSSSDYHKKGEEKDKNGNFKGAIKQYQKALDLDPNNVEILEKMVFAKSNTGQYGSAIDNLNTLLELKPQSSKYYFFRGFSHFNLKNYNAAVLDYTKAIESQEDKISDFNIYSERGLCKMRLKDYTGAIIDFNQSLSIYNDPGIIKNKKEAEIKLIENPPTPKLKVIETTNLHYIYLKKPVLTTN
jgi:tetratricopeptide (TPR) repeat protein